MSFEATFVLLNDRFDTQFSALQPDVEIMWPNVADEPNEAESWVRPFMLPGRSRQAAIGLTRLWRNVGVYMVQVFSPTGTGEEVGLAIADSVVAAMRGITISGVRLKATSMFPRAGVSGGKWFQHNVGTPYEYDDVTTT